MIAYLAFRSLYRQRKRYALVAVAVAVGFALVTIITAAAYGALEAVKDKAARYFAGHVSISGYMPDDRWGIQDPEAVLNLLSSSELPIRRAAPRVIYYKNDATIFFGGEKVRQRKLIGVSFADEGAEFTGLSFSEGGWEEMPGPGGENGILVSETAARLLKCRIGDDLTLYLTTDTGQYNTATLIVKGIFQETSLFGYVAYMNGRDLNRLLLRESDAATDIAVYAKNGTSLSRLTENIRLELSRRFAVFPAFASREERDAMLAEGVVEPTLSVLSMEAQLAQITQFLDALLAITYFTLVLFLAIVMVGILNTYRVLVHERTREIGAMRALGMQREHVVLMFLVEAFFLALASIAAGLILGCIGLRALASVDFSALPGAGMFLEGGRLRFSLNVEVVALNTILMHAAVLCAAGGPSRRAGDIKPADAMRNAA